MSDLVTRLRGWRNVHLARLHLLMEEAADEMERLSANGDFPVADNAANEDNTPAANATPREGIEQDGCTLTDAAEVRRLRCAIAALADQAATLSVCNGNVTVTMDATLTDAEREAVEWCVEMALNSATDCAAEINTLRGLLERL